MAELVGNKAIEDAAVKWVMDLERAVGRQPHDTRYKGAAADIESPPRVIEVKAFGNFNRGYDLWLETRQVNEARKNPNFYVYVVENVRQGDPALFTLRVLGGARLRHLLTRAKDTAVVDRDLGCVPAAAWQRASDGSTAALGLIPVSVPELLRQLRGTLIPGPP